MDGLDGGPAHHRLVGAYAGVVIPHLGGEHVTHELGIGRVLAAALDSRAGRRQELVVALDDVAILLAVEVTEERVPRVVAPAAPLLEERVEGRRGLGATRGAVARPRRPGGGGRGGAGRGCGSLSFL